MTAKRKTGFYWHVHHNKLVEWCWGYDERVTVIRQYKPKHEQPTRLRLFQPVKGKLADELVVAGKAYDKTYEANDKASEAYEEAGKVLDDAYEAHEKAGKTDCGLEEACDRARQVFDRASEVWGKARGAESLAGGALFRALPAHKAELEALHAEECGCTEWDGKELVFPEPAKDQA